VIINLGKVFSEIPDELETKFRIITVAKYGVARGSLSQALAEAIKLFIEKNKEVLPEF
jgi:hypothetical protein